MVEVINGVNLALCIAVIGAGRAQYEFRAYARNLKAPLYDIHQFASIPEEVIKNI